MKTTAALLCASVLALTACSPSPSSAPDTTQSDMKAEMAANQATLASILDAQPDATKARYQYRHPGETLAFFGVQPGDTVAEVLPGGGWYSKIILPYIGDEGTLIGIDYPLALWPEFGFANAEFLEAKKTWPETWTAGAMEWRGGASPDIKAFALQNRDTALDGTVDYVLFIRALHNLARFDSKGGYLTSALADAYAVLKPGGIVGVVQHRAPESNSDEWADGNQGYLKQSMVISVMEAAGFEFVGSSEINANAKDTPSEDDIVWRLPPSIRGGKDNPELTAAMTAIGESDRMTLKFRKP